MQHFYFDDVYKLVILKTNIYEVAFNEIFQISFN